MSVFNIVPLSVSAAEMDITSVSNNDYPETVPTSAPETGKYVYKLTDTMKAGGEYLIVSADTAGSAFAMTNDGGTSSGTSLSKSEVSIMSGDLNNDDISDVYIVSDDNSLVWTATANGDGFDLTNNDDYIEGKSGNIKIFDEKQWLDRYWTYSGSQLIFVGGSTTYTLYYSNNSFTSTYNSSDEKIYIYEKIYESNWTNIGFTSDIHDSTDELRNWITYVQEQYDPDLDAMVYGGDYSYQFNKSSHVAAFNEVVSITDELVGEGKGCYTIGNHEYLDASGIIDEIIDTPGMMVFGEIKKTDNYIIFAMGARTSSDAYSDEDIEALNQYLAEAPSNIPVFIITHYPLHTYRSRTTKNADKVIDVLNRYPNTVFLWSHNHSLSDPHYGEIKTAGDSINYASNESKDINFTYLSSGSMNRENQVKNNSGLVATISGDEVKSVTFQYHRSSNGDKVGLPVTVSMIGESVDPTTEPTQPATPDEPEFEYDYEVQYNDTVLITNYNGSAAEVVIPETIEGKPVTRIDSSAFSYNDSIERVVLPAQAYNVGSYCFEGCSNLREVVFPDSFKTISYCAFFDCPSLKSMTIPDTVYVIDSYALGYGYDEDWNRIKYDDFTICGYAGTAAEEYALNNDINFVAIEVPEYQASIGERLTAPEGKSIFSFTPDKDTVVYFHAIGDSGVSGKFSDESRYSVYSRSKIHLLKANQSYSVNIKTQQGAAYEGYDFAIEEIPVTNTVLGKTLTFDYKSPLAFEDASPDGNNYDYYTGNHLIGRLPMQVVRVTADEDCWLSYETVNDGVRRHDAIICDDDLYSENTYQFGKDMVRAEAGNTYSLIIYSSEEAIEDAAGITYDVALDKTVLQKLHEGDNTITRAPGSGEEYYEFYCPSLGWWTFSVPDGVTREDIDLRYKGGVAGYYFELNRRMQVVPIARLMVFKVSANDTDEDKTFNFNISKYHYPEIKLNETKRLATNDSATLSYEFNPDKPTLVEVKADALIQNGNASIDIVDYENNKLAGYMDLQNGENSFRFFAEPGVYYHVMIDGDVDEDYDGSVELDVTLTDVSESADVIVPGEEINVEISPSTCNVFSFTPDENCLITVESDLDVVLNVSSDGEQKVLIGSGESSAAMVFLAGRTYYLYYDYSYDDNAGELKLTKNPVIPGDVDDDGEAGVIDATIIQRYNAGFMIPVSEEILMLCGDVDGDGEVGVIDATLIQRFNAGFITPYSIGELV